MQRRRVYELVTRMSTVCSNSIRRSDWRSATGVAKIEKLESQGRSPWYQPSHTVQRGGVVALFGAMGVVGYYAFDDLLIYEQCSSKAMETASQDPRMKQCLGEEIHRGPWHWFAASIAIAQNRHSASCTFPISGSQGTGSLRLKAVRLNGLSDQMVGGGGWEVLMLEAIIPSFSDGSTTPKSQKINLMQTSDDLKTGDANGGGGMPCMSSSVREV